MNSPGEGRRLRASRRLRRGQKLKESHSLVDDRLVRFTGDHSEQVQLELIFAVGASAHDAEGALVVNKTMQIVLDSEKQLMKR
jgi:hypothetical protein